MNFSYLKSINSMDEALFSGAGREIKTKQIITFAGLSILSLILVHKSIFLALPFFLLGLVYLNYHDDVLPLSSYLSVLQQYRKLKKKQTVQKKQTRLNVRSSHLKFSRSIIKLPSIPTEIQLLATGVVTILAGVYGIDNSVFNEDFAGLIVGAVLTALGLVILLSVISPFLNKLSNENSNE